VRAELYGRPEGVSAMPGVTPEQIKAAKTVDLLSYLRAAEPGELKKTGSPNEYRTVSHGSLVISNGKWIWNRGGLGGRTALDYLIKVRDMGFVAAVETVLESRAAYPHVFSSLPVENPKHAQPKELRLPQRAAIPSKAVKYLQRRGIHSDIISECLKSGILYEGVYKNMTEPELDGSAVCVFVGKGENGTERFAAIRGIGTDLKRDAAGSDKRFGFTLPSVYYNSRSLAVFEAPVDLLSHASLTRRGDIDFEGHRLSLGGTSDVALMAYLERNPQTEYISLCLDNDEAGRGAAQRIFNKLGADERYSGISVTLDWPNGVNDYNDLLLHKIDLEREQRKNAPEYKDVLSF
jgi:hypothetical protein